MPGRAQRRLEQLASPLEPARKPFYVRLPVPPGLERTFPAEGWYWVPHEHHTAVYLAATFHRAAIELDKQLVDQLHTAEQP